MPRYFSPLRRTIEQMLTQRMPANQWLGTLTNAPGVKEAELVDSGLKGFLTDPRRGNGGPIDRQELLDHLDTNGVGIDEVLLGGPREPRANAVVEQYHYPDRESAIDALLNDNEDFWEFEMEYRDNAMDDWADGFRRGDYAVVPYDPGSLPFHLRRRGYVPPIRWEGDEATGDLFDNAITSSTRGYYLEDHPDDGAAWRAGDPVRWHIAEPNSRPHPDNGNLRINVHEPADAPNWVRHGWEEGFDTEQDALDHLDDLDNNRWDYIQNAFQDSPEEHEAYQQARQDYLARHLGRGEYTFPDDGEEPETLGPIWKKWALKGGQDYGELIITQPSGGARGYPSHFGDIPGAAGDSIAHVRFDTRTDAEGKRTLLIQEVQSDVHQRGREGGYKSAQGPEAYQRLLDLDQQARTMLSQTEPSRSVRDANTAQIIQALRSRSAEGDVPLADALEEALALSIKYNRGVVPDAPLKNNRWAELVMKRMIRWAADHGFDRLAWVPGNVKNGAVYAGKVAGSEFYDNVLPNIVGKLIKKAGGKIGRTEINIGRAAGVGDGRLPVHAIDVNDAIKALYKDEDGGIPIYAGVDPTRAKTTREALMALMQTGGYGALLASIIAAERRRRGEPE